MCLRNEKGGKASDLYGELTIVQRIERSNSHSAMVHEGSFEAHNSAGSLIAMGA
jgi:hypothetical protein